MWAFRNSKFCRIFKNFRDAADWTVHLQFPLANLQFFIEYAIPSRICNLLTYAISRIHKYQFFGLLCLAWLCGSQLQFLFAFLKEVSCWPLLALPPWPMAGGHRPAFFNSGSSAGILPQSAGVSLYPLLAFGLCNIVPNLSYSGG